MTNKTERVPKLLSSAARKELFLKSAACQSGVSVSEVYRRAKELGDSVTEEAFYNLARRLAHDGKLVADHSGRGARYRLAAAAPGELLEEEELEQMVDPEYPLPALTILEEVQRQMDRIPESVWIELRERLLGQPARALFKSAIMSYCEDLHAQIAYLVEMEKTQAPASELAKLRQEAEESRQLLRSMTKNGLGLSREAVKVPPSVAAAVAEFKRDATGPYVNETLLEQELSRRIALEPFLTEVPEESSERRLLIGAVDGSSRSGVLSLDEGGADFGVGHAPMVAINTAVGQVNRVLKMGARTTPLFTRLPERPEDMQRQDNRYTIMAKLLYSDLSEAEYMHAVWNAMNLLESKVALRLLKRWYAQKTAEVAPADIVLRDGALAPQDRDFYHYAASTSLGKIVRDIMETNWEIVAKCRENGQTFAGVVKEAQLTVFGPAINWFISHPGGGTGQITSWPMRAMNRVPDRVILTRILTAGRKKNEPWVRTCVLLRPFHAVTNFDDGYSRAMPVSSRIFDMREKAMAQDGVENPGQRVFWEETFRGQNDAYVKLLDSTYYASFFVGAVPRLDSEKYLPRFEFVVPAPTDETAVEPWQSANSHRDRLIMALLQTGFDVSAEHRMFESRAKLDVLPAVIIRAHDMCKLWAAELISQVREYVGRLLARYVREKKFRGIRIRPFSPQELRMLYLQLRQERERLSGGTGSSERLEVSSDG